MGCCIWTKFKKPNAKKQNWAKQTIEEAAAASTAASRAAFIAIPTTVPTTAVVEVIGMIGVIGVAVVKEREKVSRTN
mgnify:FL=1